MKALSATNDTMDYLKRQIDKYNFIDVGKGAELILGISKERLNLVIRKLQAEGYYYGNLLVKEVGGDKEHPIPVLGPKGTTAKDVFEHRFDIHPVDDTSKTQREIVLDRFAALLHTRRKAATKLWNDGLNVKEISEKMEIGESEVALLLTTE